MRKLVTNQRGTVAMLDILDHFRPFRTIGGDSGERVGKEWEESGERVESE